MKAMLETERSETSQQKCRAVWEMYIYIYIIYGVYIFTKRWLISDCHCCTREPNAKEPLIVESYLSSKCGAKNPQNHWVTYSLRHIGMAPIRTPKIGFCQKSMGGLLRGRISSNAFAARRSTPMMLSSCAKPSLWLRVESVTLAPTKKRGKIEDFDYVIQVGRYPRWIVMWRCVCFCPRRLRPLKPLRCCRVAEHHGWYSIDFTSLLGHWKWQSQYSQGYVGGALKFTRKWCMGRKDQVYLQ